MTENVIQLTPETAPAKTRLSPLQQSRIATAFRILQQDVGLMMTEKGWNEGLLNVPEKMALIHSEISEALEAYRDPSANRGPYNLTIQADGKSLHVKALAVPTGKPEGVVYELADAVIRILHLAELMNYDLGEALLEKHEYNNTRSYRHGGKRA